MPSTAPGRTSVPGEPARMPGAMEADMASMMTMDCETRGTTNMLGPDDLRKKLSRDCRVEPYERRRQREEADMTWLRPLNLAA